MKKENNRKIRAFGSRFEWTIVKRERATGKVIKTVALDADTEIPEGVTNFSEYVRDLIKHDVETRAKAKTAAEQKSAKPEVEEPLTEIEDHLYGWMDDWNKLYGFERHGFDKYGSAGKYLKLEPNADEMFSLLGAVKDNVEKTKAMNPEHTEYFNEILAYIQSLRDRQLWNKVYEKFSKHWREEHPQPEAYKKEVMHFGKRSWTGADILEKILPQIDLLDRKPETMPQTTTKKIAEIFHVDYQTAYNKIVPRIEPILKDAGVKII